MQVETISQGVSAVSEHDFDREVLQSKVPVLVEVTAKWCPPCRALGPVLEGIAKERAGTLKVFALDSDAHPELSSRLRVRGLPTVIAFVGGSEVGRHLGLTTREKLLRLIAE